MSDSSSRYLTNPITFKLVNNDAMHFISGKSSLSRSGQSESKSQQQQGPVESVIRHTNSVDSAFDAVRLAMMAAEATAGTLKGGAGRQGRGNCTVLTTTHLSFRGMYTQYGLL